MIGSKRKVIAVIRELEKEGVPHEAFERVYAPMGLEIGAVSPEEIAISVAAEMIAMRRDPEGNWRTLSKSIFLDEHLREHCCARCRSECRPRSFSRPANRAAWGGPKRCCRFAEGRFLTAIAGNLGRRCSPVIAVFGFDAARVMQMRVRRASCRWRIRIIRLGMLTSLQGGFARGAGIVRCGAVHAGGSSGGFAFDGRRGDAIRRPRLRFRVLRIAGGIRC